MGNMWRIGLQRTTQCELVFGTLLRRKFAPVVEALAWFATKKAFHVKKLRNGEDAVFCSVSIVEEQDIEIVSLEQVKEFAKQFTSGQTVES